VWPNSRTALLWFKSHFVVLLKSDLDVQQTNLWGGFVEHLSLTKVAQQSVTKIITLILIHLVALKAQAKHELLFNEPASGFGLMYAWRYVIKHNDTQHSIQSVLCWVWLCWMSLCWLSWRLALVLSLVYRYSWISLYNFPRFVSEPGSFCFPFVLSHSSSQPQRLCTNVSYLTITYHSRCALPSSVNALTS